MTKYRKATLHALKINRFNFLNLDTAESPKEIWFSRWEQALKMVPCADCVGMAKEQRKACTRCEGHGFQAFYEYQFGPVKTGTLESVTAEIKRGGATLRINIGGYSALGHRDVIATSEDDVRRQVRELETAAKARPPEKRAKPEFLPPASWTTVQRRQLAKMFNEYAKRKSQNGSAPDGNDEALTVEATLNATIVDGSIAA